MAALLLRLTGLAKEGGTLASQVGFGVAINRSLPRPLFTDCDNPKNCRESNEGAPHTRIIPLDRMLGHTGRSFSDSEPLQFCFLAGDFPLSCFHTILTSLQRFLVCFAWVTYMEFIRQVLVLTPHSPALP